MLTLWVSLFDSPQPRAGTPPLALRRMRGPWGDKGPFPPARSRRRLCTLLPCDSRRDSPAWAGARFPGVVPRTTIGAHVAQLPWRAVAGLDDLAHVAGAAGGRQPAGDAGVVALGGPLVHSLALHHANTQRGRALCPAQRARPNGRPQHRQRPPPRRRHRPARPHDDRHPAHELIVDKKST
jgi:hypothetical protein